MNQNEATNEYLSSIDQGMSETHSKINETNKILDQFKTKLSDEFSQTKDYLLEMNAASDRI